MMSSNAGSTARSIIAPARASRVIAASKFASTAGSQSSSTTLVGTRMRTPAGGRLAGADGVCPRIAASTSAVSATVRANTPSESSVGDKGNTPSIAYRPVVDL